MNLLRVCEICEHFRTPFCMYIVSLNIASAAVMFLPAMSRPAMFLPAMSRPAMSRSVILGLLCHKENSN